MASRVLLGTVPAVGACWVQQQPLPTGGGRGSGVGSDITWPWHHAIGEHCIGISPGAACLLLIQHVCLLQP